jgi:hypothetical protein
MKDRPMDVASIRERRQARLEQAERALDRAKRERRSVYEAAIEHAGKQRPSISLLKSNSDALKGAIARGQVKRIAKSASPRSKDEGGLFTAGGARYALTDLYKPTARERVGLFKEKASRRGVGFWEEHKGTFVLGAVGITALYLIYVTAMRAKEQRASLPRGGRHMTGLYPAAMPAHALDVNNLPIENLVAGDAASDATDTVGFYWPEEMWWPEGAQ